MQKEKLSPTGRQRGMYVNAGSSDAGVDPMWDKKYKNQSKLSNE